MTTEQEKKVLSELKKVFIYDLSKVIPSLLKKGSTDVKLKLSEILQTSNSEDIAEAKTFIKQSADIMGSDLVSTLTDTIEKY
jgi:hypothetical protein